MVIFAVSNGMKYLLGFILFFSATVTVPAQNTHLFLGGGLLNYQGDLQARRFTFEQAHLYGSVGAYYELTDKLSVRLGVVAGKLSGDDKNNPATKGRNLNFTTQLLELHLGAEYDIFNSYEHRITPYVFVALAGFHFDPYTYDLSKKKIYLQPLGTEGQGFYNGRKKYSLTQLAIPFGGGIKFGITDDIHVRLEAALRKLFTDYLDDVSTTYVDESQLLLNNGVTAAELAFRSDEINPVLRPVDGGIRGNPKSKDYYYTAGISVSVRINSGGGAGKSGKTKTGCPVNVY